ncbi:MAG: hypothetical protein ACLPN1_01615 [Dissulfurispiraceae bacterium]
MGTGLAIGAASGLLVGTAAANAGQASGYAAQGRYDISYSQCMYAKGNQVPGIVTPYSRARRTPPPPPPPPYLDSEHPIQQPPPQAPPMQ